MTDTQQAYIQALSDVRSYHRWQIGQALGDMRTIQVHESAIAWLDVLIATKQHASEDDRVRPRTTRIDDLERLTKPSFDEAPDDEGGSQRREGEMDVGPSLVADGEATELGEPSQRPLDDPPVTSQPLAALDPAPGDAVLDATAGQRLTAAAVVVGLVGVQLRGPLAWPSPA